MFVVRPTISKNCPQPHKTFLLENIENMQVRTQQLIDTILKLQQVQTAFVTSWFKRQQFFALLQHLISNIDLITTFRYYN